MSVEQKEQLKMDAAAKIEEAYNLGLSDAGQPAMFTQEQLDAAVALAVSKKEEESIAALAGLKSQVLDLIEMEEQDLKAKLAVL